MVRLKLLRDIWRRKEKKRRRNGEPWMAEQEPTMRFSIIPKSPLASIKTSISILEESDLLGDLVDTRSSDAQFPMPREGEGEGEEANLPFGAAYCQVDRSHFFFGGTLYNEPPEGARCDPCRAHSRFVISASSPPAGPWRICGTMLDPGAYHIAVPYEYDRNIYLFGCPGRDVLVCDPRCSISRLGPVPTHFGMRLVMSYFIWTDTSLPGNSKPLILLQYRAEQFAEVKLLSYHVGDDRWEVFDPNFPCEKTNTNAPLLLPGTSTLLIIDEPGAWRVYDVSVRKLKGGTVRVRGMQHLEGLYPRRVFGSFCRRSSRGTFLVFAFMEGCTDEWISYPPELFYAKIRLTPPARGRKGYSAVVESQGDLMVGRNWGAYISAEPSRKRKKEAPEEDEEEEVY